MEQKFVKATTLADVVSIIILYVVHLVILGIATAFSSSIPFIIYFVICAIVALATKTAQSDISNWIARVLLSPIMMPFWLARRLRPYAWIMATSSLISKMSKPELEQAYKDLLPINNEIVRMNDDPKWKGVDLDFLKMTKNGKGEWIWGCQTWGEAGSLFEHIESALEEKKSGKG